MAILLLSTVAFAQQATPPVLPNQAPKIDILDHWRRATVAIGHLVDVGGKQSFITDGSGVIVALDGTHACLLTAKHMFFNPAEQYSPTQISMRLPKDSATSEIDLGVVVPLVMNGRVMWKTTVQESDLAVVQLPDLSKYKNVHAVGVQDFGTPDDVFQGAPIMVLGYPGILGEAYQTTPIARGGLVAWTNPDGIADKPFLVDANIFGGNSGGPVFHIRNGFDISGNFIVGGGYTFIGIISADAYEFSDVVVSDEQTYASKLSQTNPITRKPDKILAQVKNIGGIGVVEPVARIKELLEDAYGKPRGSLSKPKTP